MRKINFHINDEKYNTAWTNIKDFKNIKLNALPIYDDRYI